MRILGIDYGTKRIGLALSDEGGSIAFPHAIIENNAKSIDVLRDLVAKENIGALVIGKSISSSGDDNILEEARRLFSDKLRSFVSVEEMDERMTSHEAALQAFGRDDQARKVAKGLPEHLDDKAAQIILQRYLDRKKNI